MTDQATKRPWHINHWAKTENCGLTYLGIEDGVRKYMANGVREEFYQICAEEKYLKNSEVWGDHQGPHIAKIYPAHDEKESLANARLIIKCVNMHDELVEALTEIEFLINNDLRLHPEQVSILAHLQMKCQQTLSKTKQ